MMLFLCNEMEWELTDMDNWITIVKMSKLLNHCFRIWNLNRDWEELKVKNVNNYYYSNCNVFYDSSCDDSHYSPGPSFSSINYCLRCLISSISFFYVTVNRIHSLSF